MESVDEMEEKSKGKENRYGVLVKRKNSELELNKNEEIKGRDTNPAVEQR
jgi:hypothetical protein